MFKNPFRKSEQARFVWREDGDELVVSLEQGDKQFPSADWSATRPDTSGAIASLLSEFAQEDETAPGAQLTHADLRLTPRAVASLNANTAALLGLPPPTPLA